VPIPTVQDKVRFANYVINLLSRSEDWDSDVFTEIAEQAVNCNLGCLEPKSQLFAATFDCERLLAEEPLDIIAVGNPADGFTYYGPFENDALGEDIPCEQIDKNDQWWILPLVAPTFPADS